MRNTRIVLTLACLLAAAALTAQQPGEHRHVPEGGEKAAGMSASCHEKMAEHEAMMAKMQAMDDRLAGLVADMESAGRAGKVRAIEAVVVALAERSSQSRKMMAEDQQKTMRHMMEHMQHGTGEAMAGKGGAGMSCPMMGGAGDASAEKPGGSQSEHHLR